MCRLLRSAALVAPIFASSVAAALGAPSWEAPGVPATVTQAVVFQNDGVTFHATLYRPEVSHSVPAVVVFHAAGVGDAGAPLYAHLREGLPAIGIAALVFDRRGTGSSAGTPNVPYETLADDGIAGARAIALLPAIDPRRIGYWGLSQGGWLAIFAAERDANAAFAVSVSAPLVTPEAQMQFAMANRLRVGGYSDADVAAMLAARNAWTGYLRGDVPRSTAIAALSKIDAKPWFDLMYMPSAHDLTNDPSTSSWRKQMDDDPLAAIERIRAPALFIYGTDDPWIPVATTVDRLRVLAAAHSNVEFAVVARADHDMNFVVHERMDVSAAALARDVPRAPAYFMLLASWLARRLRLSAP